MSAARGGWPGPTQRRTSQEKEKATGPLTRQPAGIPEEAPDDLQKDDDHVQARRKRYAAVGGWDQARGRHRAAAAGSGVSEEVHARTQHEAMRISKCAETSGGAGQAANASSWCAPGAHLPHGECPAPGVVVQRGGRHTGRSTAHSARDAQARRRAGWAGCGVNVG